MYLQGWGHSRELLLPYRKCHLVFGYERHQPSSTSKVSILISRKTVLQLDAMMVDSDVEYLQK